MNSVRTIAIAAVVAVAAAAQSFGAPVPAAWFKADSIGAADGANVTTWNDSSVNANNASSLGTTPTYNTGTGASNNQPYVTFVGGASNSRFRTASNFPITGDISTTVFAVYRPTSVAPGSANGVFSWGDPFGGPAHTFGMLNNFDTAAAGSPQIQYGAGRRAFFTAGTETTSFQIAQIDKTPGPINTTTALRWDGDTIALAVSPASQTNVPSVDLTQLIIGAWGDGLSASLSGDIAELIIYDGALSEADANAVGFYLASKYGIESSYEVPEPASLGLVTVGMLVAIRRKR